MQQQPFLNILKKPSAIEQHQLHDLELLIKEYPFFETAHLLYTKALHQYQLINYSKQLRKTAIVANSRTILYNLLHKAEIQQDKKEQVSDKTPIVEAPITITNNDIKVVYIQNTNPEKEQIVAKEEVITAEEIKEEVVAETPRTEEEPPISIKQEEEKFSLDKEISVSLVQSFVEKDIIKTPELNTPKEEPSSFTEWLKAVQKDNHTYQLNTTEKNLKTEKIEQKPEKTTEKDEKIKKNKQILDDVINIMKQEPTTFKHHSSKMFTPSIDAKQSLVENEHLVTETLAKIYSIQGNIPKAIRAYEILSLKYPQKSVYFASLIENLKKEKTKNK